jgi:hypothetical protein
MFITVKSDIQTITSFPFKRELLDTAPIITNISRKSTSVIDSTRCVNKAILYSENTDVNHIDQEVLTVDKF